MGTFKDPMYLFAGDNMDPKSILKSKTLWLNIAGLVITYADVLPLPKEYVALLVAVANVINRFFTKGPVVL